LHAVNIEEKMQRDMEKVSSHKDNGAGRREETKKKKKR